MTAPLVPETYEQWQYCITVTCNQPLTPAYIGSRIIALNDLHDYMTKKFVELYGDQQRIQTLQWFDKARTVA